MRRCNVAVLTVSRVDAYRATVSGWPLGADLGPAWHARTATPHPNWTLPLIGFGPRTWNRPIFIDNVLWPQIATMKQIVDIVKSTYCGNLRACNMHISDPEPAAC